MHHVQLKSVFALAISALTATACGGGDSGDDPVVDETVTIANGDFQGYGLDAGTFTATVSASPNGVTVQWLGGSNCPTVSNTPSYSGTCTIGTGGGSIRITNPTAGPGSEVTHIVIR